MMREESNTKMWEQIVSSVFVCFLFMWWYHKYILLQFPREYDLNPSLICLTIILLASEVCMAIKKKRDINVINMMASFAIPYGGYTVRMCFSYNFMTWIVPVLVTISIVILFIACIQIHLYKSIHTDKKKILFDKVIMFWERLKSLVVGELLLHVGIVGAYMLESV